VIETRINYTVRAITAVLSLLVLLEVIHLTADQIAACGLTISAVMIAVGTWFDPKVPYGNKEAR
jgi:hypothetical protein